jgi:hypothetical protein
LGALDDLHVKDGSSGVRRRSSPFRGPTL